MTKTLGLFLQDGTTPATATDFGGVPPGTTTPSRQLVLMNTGDEPISNLAGRIEQASTADGEYRVTVGSTALSGAEQPLAALFDVGDTLNITESWNTPPGVTSTTPDTAVLVFLFD